MRIIDFDQIVFWSMVFVLNNRRFPMWCLTFSIQTVAESSFL